MASFQLELSPQVTKCRYASFSGNGASEPGIFMVGYEETTPQYIIDRKDFPFWTLEIVMAGHGYYDAGRNRYRLTPGSVFSYGPGVSHRFGSEAKQPLAKYFLVRSGTDFPALWGEAGIEPHVILQIGQTPMLTSLLEQILEEGTYGDTYSTKIIQGLESVLLAWIARNTNVVAGDISGSRKTYTLAMSLIQEEHRTLSSLADLAERSGYSGEYLCRIFRKYHGQSPYQVLLRRKMSTAWLLLRDRRLRVDAVARHVGFEDPLHFSRVFRKIMGCAPSSVHAGEQGSSSG